MPDQDEVTLSSLCDGAVEEMFQAELQKVMKNIADPNTAPAAVREIRLSIQIRPSKAREVADVIVSPSSKLAPTMSVDTVLYMGRHSGKLVAQEHNPKQLSFDNLDHVVPIEGGKDA